MSDTTVIEGPVDATPESVGYHRCALDNLNALFHRLIRTHKLQCAGYILARRGLVFAHASLGRLRPDDGAEPFRPDSIRAVASLTTAFTAAAVLQLAERGTLTLEQPVADIIKQFDTDLHRKINCFHLLTHTSGLAPDPGFSLEPNPAWRSDFQDMDDFITYALSGPTLAPPGERWAYCSAGFVILGEVVRRLSGVTYEEYAQRHILDPLGMTDTYFIVPPEKKDRVCLTGPDDSSGDQAGLFSAADGLFTTARDLCRFGQMMLNRGSLDGAQILSRKAVERMTTNQLRGAPSDTWGGHQDDQRHGLGFAMESRSTVSPGTYTREGAGQVNLVIDPAEELVAIYFVPTAIPWVPESILCPMAVILSGLD
jgi:CubicO group peptidase (beta-lactamase class C family)